MSFIICCNIINSAKIIHKFKKRQIGEDVLGLIDDFDIKKIESEKAAYDANIDNSLVLIQKSENLRLQATKFVTKALNKNYMLVVLLISTFMLLIFIFISSIAWELRFIIFESITVRQEA